MWVVNNILLQSLVFVNAPSCPRMSHSVFTDGFLCSIMYLPLVNRRVSTV
jgi:hypothetical protein